MALHQGARLGVGGGQGQAAAPTGAWDKEHVQKEVSRVSASCQGQVVAPWLWPVQ